MRASKDLSQFGRAAGAALAAVVATAGFGCAAETESAEDETAPSFTDGSGQQRPADTSRPYPDGPYGYSIGSVMPNYGFWGWVRPIDQVDSGFVQYVELAEFYNPTGDGTYAEGSEFPVGAAKPKALLIDMSAVWCGPCNDEAENVLPGRYATYKPQGGEFLVNLADSRDPGVPATYKNLKTWATMYDVDYPLVLDPAYRLGASMAQAAWPANFIVDPRTMRIVEAIAGSPDSAFWRLYEEVLAGTHTSE